jgi:hypothetical protein
VRIRKSHTDARASRIGRVVIIGDSHVHAIKEALAARSPDDLEHRVEAMRLVKMKAATERARSQRRATPILDRALSLIVRERNARVGDISLAQALKLARRLGPEDVLISVIGGNQHAVFSTIQHPQRFDFMVPDEAMQIAPKSELVPFRTLYPYFLTALRGGDGETIAAFRKATKARMIHLLAPPPKRKNHWIEAYHDTLFAGDALARQGVSRPELRMKFWRLQNRAIEEICAEFDVEVLGIPPQASDADGFLERPYYAGDATHANQQYGELVLDQIQTLAR